MKKNIILIIIFVQVFGFGQKCLEIEFVQESGNLELPTRRLMNYSSDFNSSHYELNHIINANDSLVTRSTKRVSDTRTVIRIKTIVVPSETEKSLLYKNFSKDSIQSFEQIVGQSEFAILEEKIPEIEWEISSERDTILSFEVQKATTRFFGRDYEAWFAVDIPLSDGPRRMHGLPGMILKAKSLDGIVEFYPVSISLEDKVCNIYSPLDKYPDRRRITIDERGKLVQEYVDKQQKYLNSRNPGRAKSTVFINGIEIRRKK